MEVPSNCQRDSGTAAGSSRRDFGDAPGLVTPTRSMNIHQVMCAFASVASVLDHWKESGSGAGSSTARRPESMPSC
eukprot:15460553-Alexandrium_andersonii.AAC.1